MDIDMNKINEITLASMHPGPAAFWHRYLWGKIHAVQSSHGKRGIHGTDLIVPLNMMVDDVYNKIMKEGGFLLSRKELK